MRTKNARRITDAESEHMARVKELCCSICDTPGPSEAHHVEQGKHYTCVALCTDCHRGGLMGLHGQRRAWQIRKLTELDALAVTVERLMQAAYS